MAEEEGEQEEDEMKNVGQPPRGEKDGPVGVRRLEDETLAISATYDGTERSIVVSEYNAWRIFGTLAMFLGVKLPKKLAESIKLGEVSGSVEFPHDGTIGGMVASSMAAERTKEVLQKIREKLPIVWVQEKFEGCPRYRARLPTGFAYVESHGSGYHDGQDHGIWKLEGGGSWKFRGKILKAKDGLEACDEASKILSEGFAELASLKILKIEE